MRCDGYWSLELANCFPLATANVLQQPTKVFKSTLVAPLTDIEPTLITKYYIEKESICLAYKWVRGEEHYDGCRYICTPKSSFIKRPQLYHQTQGHTTSTHPMDTPEDIMEENTLPPQVTSTPEKNQDEIETAETILTPRKMADYNTPKKKTLTRKRQAHQDEWPKNKRKQLRQSGQSYV